ncbi:MAG TPA: methionyl-tRNA formyltransferase [Anaerolineae bacterium]|nr:methionyl-tRNA formyltransferase [Anaerolineae bacterium]
MGSPDFALPSLRLLAKNYDVVGVITQPDRASGRGRELKSPPVKILAGELNLPILQPEKLKEATEEIKTWNPDVIIVAAFGQILKKEILDLPKFGCINVHASLLPRWRGAAPINAAILAGDEETGVTIMKMDVGLDTGDMLSKKSIRLNPDDTAGSVFQALSTLGAELLIETLPKIFDGSITPQPQPDEGATYAPMLKKEDGKLDFNHSIYEIERRVRAMNPWPSAWFEWNGNLLKVMRVGVGEKKVGETGNRFTVEGRGAMTCADGSIILEEVQPAGKKVMSGKSFLAGVRNWESNL